jgi:hypothetical protein
MMKNSPDILIAFLLFVLSLSADARGNGGGRPHYGGGAHSSSHEGHYNNGSGKSHKGGTYKNTNSNNRYGKHKN